MLVKVQGVIREERHVGAVKARFLLTMHRGRVQVGMWVTWGQRLQKWARLMGLRNQNCDGRHSPRAERSGTRVNLWFGGARTDATVLAKGES